LEKEMNLKQKKKIIDSFYKFCKKLQRAPVITFTGGEPFIIKRELFRVIAYCRKKYPEIRFGILSNGTLITEQDAKKLKKMAPSYVQISLDGATEKTHDDLRGKGNFKRAIAGIKRLVSNGVRTTVMTVTSKKNKKEIPKLMGLCKELGVSSFSVSELVPEGNGRQLRQKMLKPEELKELYVSIAEKRAEIEKNGGQLKLDTYRPLWVLLEKDLKKRKLCAKAGGACSAGFSALALMPNGDVMPCRRMDAVIGNLTKQTFFDIWYASELLEKLRDSNNSECNTCKFYERCGGCKAVSKAMLGSFWKKDPLCWKRKAARIKKH